MIQEVKHRWVNDCDKNRNDVINLWNRKADYFGSYDLEDALEDKVIKVITDNNLINRESKILDVGCGAGKHCTALSDMCNKVVGTDLSPKMIEYARQKALQYEKHNIEFRCDDWTNIDIIKEGLYKSFDLVMACMTPAISSYDTFIKFLSCSKGAGIYCTSTKRSESVVDDMDKLIGIKNNKTYQGNSISYIFSILWDLGYHPKIEYITQSVDSEIHIEKAFNIYTRKIRAKYGMNEEQERILKRYIEDISDNQMIYEKIEATRAVLYWSD